MPVSPRRRRSLRTTDIGNRDNAPEIVGGSPSETSEVFWSFSGPSTCQCRYKLRAGCLNEIDEEPAGRGDVGSHDHDSEPAPFIGTPLWHPNGLQRT